MFIKARGGGFIETLPAKSKSAASKLRWKVHTNKLQKPK